MQGPAKRQSQLCATPCQTGCCEDQHRQQPVWATWPHGQGLTAPITKCSFSPEQSNTVETGQTDKQTEWEQKKMTVTPGSGQPAFPIKVQLCNASSRLVTPHFKIQYTANTTPNSAFSLTSLKTEFNFYPQLTYQEISIACGGGYTGASQDIPPILWFSSSMKLITCRQQWGKHYRGGVKWSSSFSLFVCNVNCAYRNRSRSNIQLGLCLSCCEI